ncbi:histidine kinase [Tieghemostelium lacteum]|uniref:Histidine kinase n=1 Tax=Tieghemostelium lacteum TaxID=361077 RepID=A0A151ZK74_TIELA|nr:histidine kinase [Tieghemostelium lacteum]|eukprot:KYQ94214.1 histidine kinase [Tieghemostelium lacteum]
MFYLWSGLESIAKMKSKSQGHDESILEYRFKKIRRFVEAIDCTRKSIDPQFIPKVFDRYGQTMTTTTRNFNGLGIGLSIVQDIISIHGGAIYAHSDGVDKGSRFTILPLAEEQDLEYRR